MKEKLTEKISESKLKPYMDIRLKDGTIKHWSSHEELVTWISDIHNANGWDFSADHYNRSTRHWHKIKGVLDPILDHLGNASNSKKDNEVFRSELNKARLGLEEFAQQYDWALPDSRYKKFILDLCQNDSNKSVAVSLVHYLFAKSAKLYQNSTLPGDILSILPTIFELESFANNTEGRTKDALLSLDQKINEQDKLIGEKREVFEALQDAYDKQMKLQASVGYWSDKEKKHQESIEKLRCSLIFIIIGSILAIAFTIHYLADQNTIASVIDVVMETIGNDRASNSVIATSIPLLIKAMLTARMSIFILAVTLIVWLIRLVTRFLCSHIHLRNEAAERVTMINTYLALIKHDSLEGKDYISIVINALFRPSGDGVVKDEGAPPVTMLESLIRAFRPRS